MTRPTISPTRIALAFALAPVGAIAVTATCALVVLRFSGLPVGETISGTVDLAIFSLFIGGPIAYAVQTLLVLLLGTVPPAGWRGLGMATTIGIAAGAITLGSIGWFWEQVRGSGAVWFSALGALLGGTAAAFYVVVCLGVPRTRRVD